MEKVKHILKKILYVVANKTEGNNHFLLENINCNLVVSQKKVLLCYLDYYQASQALNDKGTHTNYREFFQIMNNLIHLNCVIDVCFCNYDISEQELKDKNYDFIFGFGQAFRKASEYCKNAKKILYMTENPYYISKEREHERINYYEKRMGKKCDFSRTGVYYLDDDIKTADIVVSLGETKYYRIFKKETYRIFPTGLKNESFQFDFSKKEKNKFVLFGAGGIVHKGIDILVEVFAKHPEWTLYMCGGNITNGIEDLAYKVPSNCIDMGYVKVESDEYIKIVEQCVYCLLPSCSEGMSTGLITCMNHGVIPVVTRGNGFDDLENYTEYFEDFHIEEIEKNLIELVKGPMNILEEKAKCVMEYANTEFTLEQYTKRMQEILKECMGEA